MKYYYEPNDKWYDTKQELVDAYNEDFEGTHSTKVTIDNWTEEQWNTIWKPNMKKLEIKTEKATLLVVDDSNWDGCIHEFVGVNYNGFKHLGKVSEITESEWRCIVTKVETPIHKINCYPNYYNDGYFNTAAMSGLSLLKANGVLLENKYPHPDNIKIQPASLGWYKEQLDKHNSEQEKVWSNPHVFIKVE